MDLDETVRPPERSHGMFKGGLNFKDKPLVGPSKAKSTPISPPFLPGVLRVRKGASANPWNLNRLRLNLQAAKLRG
jgi:hypothetical protein